MDQTRTEVETTGTTSEGDDWAWRAKIRSDPHAHRIYKVVVAVVGVLVVALGLVAIPAPGPGWLVVFVGLGILASEFEKAQRLLEFAKKHVHRWTEWIKEQSLVVRLGIALLTACAVIAVFWAYFALTGVPHWFPDAVEHPLVTHVPGLG